jgi:hypothetical protein
MGASASEIEQQIKDTRERIDENLSMLENRAASGAVRYGRIAAIGIGAAAAAVVVVLIYRRVRRPKFKEPIDRMSIESLRKLTERLASRLKKPLPTVKVTMNERAEGPGAVERIVRKVAPAIVGTASTALLERVTRSARHGQARHRAPRAD